MAVHGASGGGGSGGSGGAGVSSNSFGLSNDGSIIGGNGGAGGAGGSSIFGSGTGGTDGSGGGGVVSTGDSTVTSAGSIRGGLSGSGAQADAVDLSGGANTLTLENGYSFTGNVVSTSGTTNGGDTLALGGTANDTFNLAQIVAASPTGWTGTAQYYGFNNFAKTGTSTWTVAGTAGAAFAGGITVAAGTLQLGTVGAPATMGGGSAMVNAGATLSGTGTLNAPTTIAAGAMLSPGYGASVGTLNITSTLGMFGTLGIGINGTGSGNFDLLDVSGQAALGSTSFFNFMLGNDTSQTKGQTFQFFDASSFLNFADVGNNFNCSGLMSGLSCMLGMNTTGNGLFLRLDASGGGGGTTSVPEPGSLGMFGLGLLLLGGGLGWRTRRDRKEA
ncbi:MAG TPA: PEP-CTERM sorting domain-containing protein [Rhodanobacteraceae bacterium]|nr:PEP-CTERM sorting domain-containing protein [Rhodanobacteraceae bacterium]